MGQSQDLGTQPLCRLLPYFPRKEISILVMKLTGLDNQKIDDHKAEKVYSMRKMKRRQSQTTNIPKGKSDNANFILSVFIPFQALAGALFLILVFIQRLVSLTSISHMNHIVLFFCIIPPPPKKKKKKEEKQTQDIG